MAEGLPSTIAWTDHPAISPAAVRRPGGRDLHSSIARPDLPRHQSVDLAAEGYPAPSPDPTTTDISPAAWQQRVTQQHRLTRPPPTSRGPVDRGLPSTIAWPDHPPTSVRDQQSVTQAWPDHPVSQHRGVAWPDHPDISPATGGRRLPGSIAWTTPLLLVRRTDVGGGRVRRCCWVTVCCQAAGLMSRVVGSGDGAR